MHLLAYEHVKEDSMVVVGISLHSIDIIHGKCWSMVVVEISLQFH
jgi:hypothetical protein